MTSAAVRLSIRSLFLWVVMAIATLTLVIASSLSIYSQIETYRGEISNKIDTWARYLGNVNAEYIYLNENTRSADLLAHLNVSEMVSNVHLYRRDQTGELVYFTSYNKQGQPPVGNKVGSVSKLLRPKITQDIVEVARPVSYLGEDVGYIYLRASAENFNQMVGNTIVMHVSVMLIMMFASFLLALRLQRIVTTPIAQLATFLQQTSRRRDYSARADTSSIKELSMLSDAVNVMLTRIQEYMQKQQIAEEQHRQLNSSLEDMVNQRTTALKDANMELIQTLEKLHQFQRQIVENEKMASLGDMVAGVAHEVNTPIGLGVTASTMMLDRLAVIQKAFEEKTLKASMMKRFLSESQENLEIIYRNLNRAAELISSFKQVAVDQSSENSRVFQVGQLINEILLSLRPRLKKIEHSIRVECDEDLIVETKAGPINQILINLIMNSIIHGFEDKEFGAIEIFVELIDNSKLKICYKDDGRGIPEEIQKRIFDPFVTTKRGQGGSGLGMHLVYNLVTQALNGSITLSSEKEKGVEFVITFPVVIPRKRNAIKLSQ